MLIIKFKIPEAKAMKFSLNNLKPTISSKGNHWRKYEKVYGLMQVSFSIFISFEEKKTLGIFLFQAFFDSFVIHNAVLTNIKCVVTNKVCWNLTIALSKFSHFKFRPKRRNICFGEPLKPWVQPTVNTGLPSQVLTSVNLTHQKLRDIPIGPEGWWHRN